MRFRVEKSKTLFFSIAIAFQDLFSTVPSPTIMEIVCAVLYNLDFDGLRKYPGKNYWDRFWLSLKAEFSTMQEPL